MERCIRVEQQADFVAIYLNGTKTLIKKLDAQELRNELNDVIQEVIDYEIAQIRVRQATPTPDNAPSDQS